MKQFTFIFRQGQRILSPEEQQRRAGEIGEWAMARAKAGRKFAPHMLGEDGFSITPDGGCAPTPAIGEGSVIAIVVFEAADLNEAVVIGKTHPGPRYGSSIEVREWTPPATLPATDSSN